jgi:hypothetical protein
MSYDENQHVSIKDDEGVSSDEDEEDEEEEMFRRGSVLKSSDSHGEEDWGFDLDKLRGEDCPSSKRFSIMAEPLMDDGDDGKAGSDPEITPEIQHKRMSIRVLAPKASSHHKKCTFIRESGTISSKFYPHYHLYLDTDNNRLLIGAKKLTRNRNASYYLFDMSIEKDLNKCTRDSPNLIGKVVKKRPDCTQLTLQRDGDEFTAITFFRPANSEEQLFLNTAHPRQMATAIPPLDDMGNTQPHELTPGTKSLVEYLSKKDGSHGYQELRSKDPIFYNGCYRLHFLGRVPVVPSVKNFQVGR